MPVESAQMLSTAHRILDGKLQKIPSKSGKRIVKGYIHPTHDDLLYKAVHHGHPCTIWTMESSSNYLWHFRHWVALCDEFKYRYEKEHMSYTKLYHTLKNMPTNIPIGPMTPFKLAMNSNPECMFPDDPVKSYKMFYQTKQARFKMVWKNRKIPEWFEVAA
jgi:hypothetical protein